jgi:hypothetical protein
VSRLPTDELRIIERYLVVKLPVADDKLPAASRLNTWKKYCVLRARLVMVTE